MIVIVEAQENLRVALTENEKLRESNDIQNKLWKIWLKAHEDKNIEIEKAENGEPTTVNVDDNEEEDKEDDVEDPLTAFLRNRRQGFTRTNSAASAVPNSGQETKEKEFILKTFQGLNQLQLK